MWAIIKCNLKYFIYISKSVKVWDTLFSGICSEPIFYHLPKFQSLKLIRNSLMRFFKEASGFPLAQNWRQNLCRIFFLMAVLHNLLQSFIFFFFFFFFALLLILHCSDFVFRFNSLHCLKTITLFILSDFQRRISCVILWKSWSSPTKQKLSEFPATDFWKDFTKIILWK